MEISESSRLYLSNYYVLDQARQESQQYLERIVRQVTNEVEDYFNTRDDGEIHFRKYVQKDGGYAEFIFERKVPINGLETIDRWKFSIAYKDVMRTERLSSPTKCQIYCFAPQSHIKQNLEIKRMAIKLDFPDLFSPVEIELLNSSFEEVVDRIKSQFLDFHENFLKIVWGLIEEAKLVEPIKTLQVN